MNVVAAHMHVSGSVPVPEEDTEAPDLIISLLPHSLPVPSVLFPSSLLGLKFLPSSQQHTGNLEKNPRFSCSVRTLLKLFFQFLWRPLTKPIKSLLYFILKIQYLKHQCGCLLTLVLLGSFLTNLYGKWLALTLKVCLSLCCYRLPVFNRMKKMLPNKGAGKASKHFPYIL